MTAAASIPTFREINECHEATGFPVRSALPDFHIFTLEETYPCTRDVMPPFRRGFYQVTFFETLGSSTIQLEDRKVESRPDILLFSPPEQVMSWVCRGEERGIMIYFKADLLASRGRPIEEVFPFFEPSAVSVLPVDSGEKNSLFMHFSALRAAAGATHAYRQPQLAGLLSAFLYECRGMHDRLGGNTPGQLGAPALVTRFRQMVASCFSLHCTVESYAECLHVSADHLRAMVKKHSGRTASAFINDRVLLEARRLLAHTDLSVSEVAWHLRFEEPTHFTRFFKRHQAKTPLEYRREAQGTGRSA